MVIMVNHPVSSGPAPQARRRPVRRTLAAGAASLVLVGVGLWARDMWTAYRALHRQVAIVQRDVVRHQDRRALTALLALHPALVRLDRDWAPLRLLTPVPVVGAVGRDLTGALDVVDGLRLSQAGLEAALANGSEPPLARLHDLLGSHLAESARLWRQAAGLLGAQVPRWPPVLGRIRTEAGAVRQLAQAAAALARVRGPLRAALGYGAPARYLFLFQDGGELRATGGFLAAWALVTVQDGRIGPAVVHGIHSLAQRSRLVVPAPWAFQQAFHYSHLSFFDANVSPNGPTTGRRLARYFAATPRAPPLAGVILGDTWLFQQLLRVVGPIPVRLPAMARPTVVTASNAEQTLVTLAEGPGAAGAGRKQFLTPLLATLRARAASLPPAVAGAWARALLAALVQEHLWLWSSNPALESFWVQIGIAAAMPVPARGNFLEVVDENLGAHKDNAFMTQSVEVTLLPPRSGRVVERIAVALTLDAPADGRLVVPYTGWLRWYLPVGTRLLSVHAAKTRPLVRTWRDSPRRATVVGAAIAVPPAARAGGPPGRSVVIVTVELPRGLAAWPLTVGKQPGLPAERLQIVSRGQRLSQVETTALVIRRRGGRLRAASLTAALFANLQALPLWGGRNW